MTQQALTDITNFRRSRFEAVLPEPRVIQSRRGDVGVVGAVEDRHRLLPLRVHVQADDVDRRGEQLRHLCGIRLWGQVADAEAWFFGFPSRGITRQSQRGQN